MQWIDEADAVFRGGGVKGLALAGALLRVRRASDEARAHVEERRRRERGRDHRLLPRDRTTTPRRCSS